MVLLCNNAVYKEIEGHYLLNGGEKILMMSYVLFVCMCLPVFSYFLLCRTWIFPSLMRFLGKDFVMSFLERTNKRCEKIKNLSYFIFPPSPPPPTSKEKKTSNHIFFFAFVAVCVRVEFG